jgi:hypothetical protein
LFLFHSYTLAASDLLHVSIDKSNATVNDTLVLSIEVKDAQLKNLSFPTETNDYRVIAQSSSSNIQIINGVMAQEKLFKLVLRPKHSGQITIPSVSMKLNGQTHSSDPISVGISNGASIPSAPINPAGSHATAVNIPRTEEPVDYPNIFARLSLSKSNLYTNEQVLLKLKIYHTGNLRTVNIPEMDLNDFVHQRIGEAKEYRESFNNGLYYVYEIDYLLFPIKSGLASIPAVQVETTVADSSTLSYNPFDPFSHFSQAFIFDRPVVLKSNSINMQVQALPPAPKGFSGYVGDLSVKNEINKNTVDEDEAVTITSTIYGNGNPNNISLNNLIEESQQYSVFKDQESRNSEITNSVQYFQISAKTAVVPHSSRSRLSIKAKPIIIFNPSAKRYETLGAEEFLVDVAQNPVSKQHENKSQKAKKTRHSKIQEEESKQEILSLSASQIISGSSRNPLPIIYLVILGVLTNLISMINYLYENLFKNRKSLSVQEKAGSKKINFNKIELSLKETKSIPEITKILKELCLKLQNKYTTDTELQERMERFFAITDKAIYGFDPDIKDKLEELRKEARAILKELRRINARS